MARLAIYNGNALVREVDVPEGMLRVGRSDQNDIVLIDPGKAVSRFHAELRIEHGTCVVVDLNSRNGTWVAGRRVPQATLVPGQAVLVGTHRLVFKVEEPRHEAVQAARVPEAAEQPPTAAPEPAATSEPVPHAAEAAPDTLVESKAAAPSSAVHALVIPRAVPPPSLAPTPVGRLRRALLLVAGSICVAVAGVAGGMFWWPASSGAPGAAPKVAVQPAAPQPVLGGPPTETPATPTGVGPMAAPVAETPAAAAETVSGANATVAPVAAIPAPVKAKRSVPAPGVHQDPAPIATPKAREFDATQLIARARAAIGRGDYAAGLGFLKPVMRVDAGNPEVLDLLAAVRAQGHEAFKRGRQFDALGRTPEAIAMYEKAASLLPPDHPSAQTAKERLAVLR